jgi:hypothetical protein
MFVTACLVFTGPSLITPAYEVYAMILAYKVTYVINHYAKFHTILTIAFFKFDAIQDVDRVLTRRILFTTANKPFSIIILYKTAVSLKPFLLFEFLHLLYLNLLLEAGEVPCQSVINQIKTRFAFLSAYVFTLTYLSLQNSTVVDINYIRIIFCVSCYSGMI